jgi:hypothetical protein
MAYCGQKLSPRNQLKESSAKSVMRETLLFLLLLSHAVIDNAQAQARVVKFEYEVPLILHGTYSETQNGSTTNGVLRETYTARGTVIAGADYIHMGDSIAMGKNLVIRLSSNNLLITSASAAFEEMRFRGRLDFDLTEMQLQLKDTTVVSASFKVNPVGFNGVSGRTYGNGHFYNQQVTGASFDASGTPRLRMIMSDPALVGAGSPRAMFFRWFVTESSIVVSALEANETLVVRLIDLRGRLLAALESRGEYEIVLPRPETCGLYLLQVSSHIQKIWVDPR